MTTTRSGAPKLARSHFTEILELVHGNGRRISAICALEFRDHLLDRTADPPQGAIRWRAEHDKMGVEVVDPITPRGGATLERLLAERPGVGVGCSSRTRGTTPIYHEAPGREVATRGGQARKAGAQEGVTVGRRPARMGHSPEGTTGPRRGSSRRLGEPAGRPEHLPTSGPIHDVTGRSTRGRGEGSMTPIGPVAGQIGNRASTKNPRRPCYRWVFYLGALSSVGLERLPYKQEVTGSNPVAPMQQVVAFRTHTVRSTAEVPHSAA